jgi:hypothetical protein
MPKSITNGLISVELFAPVAFLHHLTGSKTQSIF